jgi:hypothetical protein
MKSAKARGSTKGTGPKAKPTACEGCPRACGRGKPAANRGRGSGEIRDERYKQRCRGCPAACCRGCAYAGRVRDGGRVLLICVNRPDAPGLMRKVPPTGACRNFRPRQIRAGRRKRPKAPPDDVRYIALTRDRFATVDACDYDRIARYRWFAVRQEGRYYARRNAKGGAAAYMHREVVHAPKGMVVDHRDNNGTSNCQVNLRVCTQQENSYNSRPHGCSSKYKGVSYLADLDVWQAAICTEYKTWPIGNYQDEVEAARAYDREAYRRFGAFAWLNFPEEIKRIHAKQRKRRRVKA